MGRTKIAGVQPQTYETLQSDARKTIISQHEINDMGFVQSELFTHMCDPKHEIPVLWCRPCQ